MTRLTQLPFAPERTLVTCADTLQADVLQATLAQLYHGQNSALPAFDIQPKSTGQTTSLSNGFERAQHYLAAAKSRSPHCSQQFDVGISLEHGTVPLSIDGLQRLVPLVFIITESFLTGARQCFVSVDGEISEAALLSARPSTRVDRHSTFKIIDENEWLRPTHAHCATEQELHAWAEHRKTEKNMFAQDLPVHPLLREEHPVLLFNTKVGAIPQADLLTATFSADAIQANRNLSTLYRFARTHPALGRHYGLNAELINESLAIPLPGTMMAVADFMINTNDALGPNLRIIVNEQAHEARAQLHALANNALLIPDAAAAATPSEALAAAVLHSCGAWCMPDELVQIFQAKASQVLADPTAAQAGLRLKSAWLALCDLLPALLGDLTEPAKDTATFGQQKAVLKARIAPLLDQAGINVAPRTLNKALSQLVDLRRRSTRIEQQRANWLTQRGWSFRQEVGIREFFRLHAEDIAFVAATTTAYTSYFRRYVGKILGFDIYGKRIGYPTYAEFRNNCQRAADLLKIPKEYRMRFVICYEAPDGSIVTTEPEAVAPQGCRPLLRPLTTKEILKLIDDRKFPLAHNEFLDQTGDIFYVHDAHSHGLEFLTRWRNYIVPLLTAAAALVRREGSLAALGNSVNRNGPLSDRIFYIVEELVNFRSRIAAAHFETVEALPAGLLAQAGIVVSSPAGNIFKLPAILAGMETLPVERLRTHASALLAALPDLMEAVGGNAQDDLLIRQDKNNDLQKHAGNKRMFFLKAWKILRQAMAQHTDDRATLLTAYARLLTYTLQLTVFDNESLTLDAMRPLQDETSSFWQLLRGTGLLDPHDPEEFIMLKNHGLVDDLLRTAELGQTQVKYLIPDLSKLPAAILKAISSGEAHPAILRRGLVLQDYVPVTYDTVKEIFQSMAEANIPFGDAATRDAFTEPGNAAEIRLMRKSLRVREAQNTLHEEEQRDFLQIGIRGIGGISISSVQSPETLTVEQRRKLDVIVTALRSKVTERVKKAYFEIIATDTDGKTLLRPDGTPYTIEIDIALDNAVPGTKPFLIMGEVQLRSHEETSAQRQAAQWRSITTQLRPSYLTLDLSESVDQRILDVVRRGAPSSAVASALQSAAQTNQTLLEGIMRDFMRWVSADLKTS